MCVTRRNPERCANCYQLNDRCPKALCAFCAALLATRRKLQRVIAQVEFLQHQEAVLTRQVQRLERQQDERRKGRTRHQKRVVFQGEDVPLATLAERIGMPYILLRDRIFRYGWRVDEAVSTPRQMRIT